jgi:hypothetical protein
MKVTVDDLKHSHGHTYKAEFESLVIWVSRIDYHFTTEFDALIPWELWRAEVCHKNEILLCADGESIQLALLKLEKTLTFLAPLI